ncbi:MAG: class I SAM-dependent methyltransferase [Rhodobacteraceae bacterium]|nr:class I SAM-dependent methyltransferase [Paracoccaceae bacterium]
MFDNAPHRNCPACASGGAATLAAYSPEDWNVAACEACGFVYLRNPPDYEALKEESAWEKTYEAKKATSRGSTVFSPLARRIRNGLGMYRDKTRAFGRWFNNGHVLDIGCGWGQRIQPPMTPYGIELSTSLHKISDEVMRARGGYCLFGPGAEAIGEFDPEMFDGIVMFSYLEHETQVMDVLKGANRALKPTGAVFIRVPNFGSLNRRVIGPKWCGFRYPDHVNYFTLQSLRDVAGRAGFSVELINRVTLPIDDNISVLLRKSQPL